MGANSDDTTKSLERMYTFNLSRIQKQAVAKLTSKTTTSTKGDTTPAGVPSGEDAVDIKPIDMSAKNKQEAENSIPLTAPMNPEEENKQAQTERAGSQVS